MSVLVARLVRIRLVREGTGQEISTLEPVSDALLECLQVAIHWTIAMVTRFNLAANSIQSGHQQGCEEQVWVRGWIGWAELNALRSWVLGQWDSYSGTAIAF